MKLSCVRLKLASYGPKTWLTLSTGAIPENCTRANNTQSLAPSVGVATVRVKPVSVPPTLSMVPSLKLVQMPLAVSSTATTWP